MKLDQNRQPSACKESLITSKATNWWAQAERHERLLLVKYAVLTLSIFLPLIWAFFSVRNLCPFAAWNVMMAGGDLERGRSFCILRGETVSGESVEIRPINLTNALY